MSVNKDPSGRRSVQAEAIVTGTPEQVWEAISTGPGVSSWFVPCQIDGQVGGKIVSSFRPGMESVAMVTGWNPPHSFNAESPAWAPGAPTMATEWTVKARSGGTCVVRVVHSWFAETDDWDKQFESTELGWAAFFRDLELYLVHFNGQPSKTFQLMGFSTESQDATWTKLVRALGMDGKTVGAKVISPDGAPKLSGEVKYVAQPDHPETVLLLSGPAPGVGHFFAMPMGGMVCLSVRVFLFGNQAAETAAREEAVWTAWLGEHFPMPVRA